MVKIHLIRLKDHYDLLSYLLFIYNLFVLSTDRKTETENVRFCNFMTKNHRLLSYKNGTINLVWK